MGTGGRGVPGQVIADHGGSFRVVMPDVQYRTVIGLARMSGGLQHRIQSRIEWPQVGDFVVVSRGANLSTIEDILPRKTALLRKDAGKTTQAQVMVANVDVVFILDTLNRPLNVGRLERSLVLAYESGAEPVVVMTKVDLTEDPETELREAQALAVGVPVLGVSALTGDGLAALEPMDGD